MTGYTVRDVRERDREAWQALWTDYLAFYESELPTGATDATWQRLLDGEPDVGGFLAVDGDDAPVGFVHYVAHPTTWDPRPVGYVQDLFVAPGHRRSGVGRTLLERVIALGRNRGWCEISWITAAGNDEARRLYRTLAAETDWVRYEVDLAGSENSGGNGGASR